MSDQPTDRTGRFDLLVKDGLGMLADRLGIRAHVQPVIDRFVDEQVVEHKMPVTPEAIAEHMGLLKKRPNPASGNR